MEPSMMRGRLGDARVARLATVDADGRPHLVPVCFALVMDRIITVVDHKPKTTTALRRLDNVRANPDVTLLVDHYDENWAELWWVRVDGHAAVVDIGSDLDALLAALQEKYPGNYGAGAPLGPAIVVDVHRWVGWSAASGV